ncbi:MAG: DUF3592 domain-containing protein [Pseudomonadota bacterium]
MNHTAVPMPRSASQGRLRELWFNGGILFIPVAVLLAVTWFIGAGVVRDRTILSDWDIVKGTVISAVVESCGKSGKGVRATYRYTVAQQDYVGKNRAAGTNRCARRELVDQMAKDAVGRVVDIYYDPARPGEAVLGRPDIGLARYIMLGLCALLVAAVIGMFAHAIFSAPVGNKDLTGDDIAADAAQRHSEARHAPVSTPPL